LLIFAPLQTLGGYLKWSGEFVNTDRKDDKQHKNEFSYLAFLSVGILNVFSRTNLIAYFEELKINGAMSGICRIPNSLINCLTSEAVWNIFYQL
jgi:hypothetical protein